MLLNKAYYTFKFLVPRRLQIQLRRYYVNRKRSQYAETWPIDPNAAKPREYGGKTGAAPYFPCEKIGSCTGFSGQQAGGKSGAVPLFRGESIIGSCPPFLATWPNGKKFAFVLTHDVESAEGLDKCYQLAELEERLGFRSSFNFVAGDYPVPAALRQHLTGIGGHDAASCPPIPHGLYHDNNPFRSKSIFRKQSVEVNRTLKEWGAVGFRSPSMYHDLEMLHHLDIEYDASTFDTDPFEPQPDGMSTIFPFWVPDRDRQKGKAKGKRE